ncbi:MAG: heavy-metal-associated domain-containing protein [Roseiflexaceae bacterium]
MDTMELPVAGVTCGGCANRVTKALMAVEGVTEVMVSEDRNKVTIVGAQLVRPVLVSAIQAAGYQVPSAMTISLGDSGPKCC